MLPLPIYSCSCQRLYSFALLCCVYKEEIRQRNLTAFCLWAYTAAGENWNEWYHGIYLHWGSPPFDADKSHRHPSPEIFLTIKFIILNFFLILAYSKYLEQIYFSSLLRSGSHSKVMNSEILFIRPHNTKPYYKTFDMMKSGTIGTYTRRHLKGRYTIYI